MIIDPNEVLKEAREAIEKVDNPERPVDLNDIQYDTDVALRCYAALDEWISKGGALPDAWKMKSVHDDLP